MKDFSINVQRSERRCSKSEKMEDREHSNKYFEKKKKKATQKGENWSGYSTFKLRIQTTLVVCLYSKV